MKKAGFILILLTLTITQAACRLTAQPQPQPIEPTFTGPTAVMPEASQLAPGGPALLSPTLAPDPATTCGAAAQPELYGLWMKEHDQQRDMLTISEKSIYLVETDTTGERVRARIILRDPIGGLGERPAGYQVEVGARQWQ